MKITRLLGPIKLRFLVALVASVQVGCTVVHPAPFSARADTTTPGDLLGPFEGRVIDSAAGRPIAGALVFASWGFEVGRGLVAPAGAVTAEAETDSDGRYAIPSLSRLPFGGQVRRFTLIVYKRGFVAYRSDRRFEDLGRRYDFSQTGNLVRLERTPPTLSHVQHLRFVGGGGALRRALATELVEASLELQQSAGGLAAGPPLDAGALLPLEELRAATGFTGEMKVERLGDLPQTALYDSRHFRAVDKAESFDAAFRVWKLPSSAVDARFAILLSEVPHAVPSSELGDRALRGYDGKILAVAVEDRRHGLVIELTCGNDLCHNADAAMALLRRMFARGDRFGSPSEAAQPEAVEPEPKEEAAPEDNSFRLRPPELHR